MNLLNLDALVDNKREVQLGGKVYRVAEQTVGMMLKAIEVAKQAKSEKDGEEIFLDLVEAARHIVPDCSDSVLHSMNFRQLTALVEFGVATEEDAATRADDGDEETPEGK